jgi:hypothetical protein
MIAPLPISLLVGGGRGRVGATSVALNREAKASLPTDRNHAT